MDGWYTLEQARARTGLHPDTLRKQVRKGEREGRKDNHGRWLVRVDPGAPGPAPGPIRPNGPGAPARADPDLVRALAERDVQLARLEERLAAADAARRQVEEIKEAFRQRVEELRAELERERRAREEAERRRAEDDRRYDEVLRQIEELREERRQRRPRPGLRAWWRRLIEGEG